MFLTFSNIKADENWTTSQRHANDFHCGHEKRYDSYHSTTQSGQNVSCPVSLPFGDHNAVSLVVRILLLCRFLATMRTITTMKGYHCGWGFTFILYPYISIIITCQDWNDLQVVRNAWVFDLPFSNFVFACHHNRY